jgi:hypothetical protein
MKIFKNAGQRADNCANLYGIFILSALTNFFLGSKGASARGTGLFPLYDASHYRDPYIPAP